MGLDSLIENACIYMIDTYAKFDTILSSVRQEIRNTSTLRVALHMVLTKPTASYYISHPSTMVLKAGTPVFFLSLVFTMPHQLPPKARAQIVELRARGVSIYKVATQFNIHPSTVGCIVKRHTKTRSFYSGSGKTGPPRVLRQADARFAALSLSRGRTRTATNIQREQFPDVSPQTVRWRLRKLGIYAYVRRRVPFLLFRHVKARLKWATEYALWQAREWRRVLFSDELRFKIFGGDGYQYCWRRPGEGLDPCYTRKVLKHGGGSVMVWGCITAGGVGRLVRIEGTMTAIKYTQVLQEGLLGTLEDHNLLPDDIIFQQDNDPKHKS